MAAKKCLYEVLQVSQDANDADLKRAYRVAALAHHPDKNRGREDEAAEQFKLVQGAYEVLSDPHERAWYDAHRAQILRGGDADAAGDATATDLFAHFSSACYDGFSDGPRSFYAVYAKLFADLDQEEVLAAGRDARRKAAPAFGEADAEWDDVRAFYAHWEGFTSVKTFAFADKWNLADGHNRELRRLMEKDNRKDRAKAKKEFNVAVREIVAFVRKRDPRVKARKAREEGIKREKEEQRRVKEVEEAAENKRRAKEAKIAREDAMEEDAVALDEILRNIELDDEIERRKTKRRAERADDAEGDESEELAGEEYGVEDVESEEEEEENLYCVACKKKFRTSAQARNHETSKKHIAAAAALRAQIEEEDAMFHDARDSEEIVGTGASGATGDVLADDVLGDEEEADFTMPAPSKKKKKKNAKKRQQQRLANMEANVVEDVDDAPAAAQPSAPKLASDCAQEPDREPHAEILGTTVQEERKPPLSKKEKRRQREKLRAEEQKSGGSGSSASLVCNVCSASFPSRTKLMKHVEKVGHARMVAPLDAPRKRR